MSELPEGTRIQVRSEDAPAVDVAANEQDAVLESDVELLVEDDDPEIPEQENPTLTRGLWNGSLLMSDVQEIANAVQNALGAVALQSMQPDAPTVDFARETIVSCVTHTSGIIRSRYVNDALETLHSSVAAHRDPSDENKLVSDRALAAFVSRNP